MCVTVRLEFVIKRIVARYFCRIFYGGIFRVYPFRGGVSRIWLWD